MVDEQSRAAGDVWSQWLLHDRHADDPHLERAVRGAVDKYIDRVLDGASLTAGMTLVDVGAGEGAVAFRAIDRIGASLRVLFTDISGPLLQHAAAEAQRRGVHEQCTFLTCSADRLTSVSDACANAVTTRSVLAYVGDKGAALRDFHRVLVPGGRLSIAEPVLQDDANAAWAMRTLIETRPVESLDPALPLLHRWKAAQYPDTQETIRQSAIAGYNERDLVRFAQLAGFVDIHLELHIDVVSSQNTSWDLFLRSSPHPLAPPLSRILAEQFTPEERLALERAVRPLVENPNTPVIDRMAYLIARRPA